MDGERGEADSVFNRNGQLDGQLVRTQPSDLATLFAWETLHFKSILLRQGTMADQAVFVRWNPEKLLSILRLKIAFA